MTDQWLPGIGGGVNRWSTPVFREAKLLRDTRNTCAFHGFGQMHDNIKGDLPTSGKYGLWVIMCQCRFNGIKYSTLARDADNEEAMNVWGRWYMGTMCLPFIFALNLQQLFLKSLKGW